MWLTILLQIISALIPEFIKLIISIFDKSKQLPADEQSAVRSELKELAWNARKSSDQGPLKRLKERVESRLKELKKG